MNNPLVSIIVPVYNAQNSVARCLESICAQTWKNIEIIVLNDGSTDDSLAICNQFREKDPRVIVVDKGNEGAAITRNCGLLLTQGKYIQFVDSDDKMEPCFTEMLVRTAEEQNADLVITPYWMVIPYNSTKAGAAKEAAELAQGREPVQHKTEVHKYGFLPEGVYDKLTYARRLMQQPASFYYSVLWNKLYRRDLILEHEIRFSAKVRWAEDLLFNLDYMEHAEVFASISYAGYHYIQNAQSICHTQIDLPGIVQNKLQVFHHYKELYTRLGLYEELQPQLYKFLFAFSESAVPADSFQNTLADAMSYLNDASIPSEPKEKNPKPKVKKHARKKKPDALPD